MPIDTNLPASIILYFELIDKYLDLQSDLDSGGTIWKMIDNKIAIYFDLIDQEMLKATKDENDTKN